MPLAWSSFLRELAAHALFQVRLSPARSPAGIVASASTLGQADSRWKEKKRDDGKVRREALETKKESGQCSPPPRSTWSAKFLLLLHLLSLDLWSLKSLTRKKVRIATAVALIQVAKDSPALRPGPALDGAREP